MKTKCLLTAIYCLISLVSIAQKFNYGVKSGVNYNLITGMPFYENYTANFHIGGFTTYSLGEKWQLQGELFFSQVHADTSISFRNYSFRKVKRVEVAYLYVPIMMSYNVSRNFLFQFGQQTSFNMYDNLVSSGTRYNPFKAVEIALAGGMAFKYRKFGVYGRYSIGLNTQNNIVEIENWKNQSLQFGLQYFVFK